MNDRKPSYKLVTLNGEKPYADGDRAQATVVEHLQLVDQCQEDPSLIVVDIGAYLGNLTCTIQKTGENYDCLSMFRRLWFICSSMWLPSIFI